ncbi:hypothetical protein BE20_25180, partial [Sorangium cellulosum]
MADKQDILATAIPDLVQCPQDFKREFEPVKDIHIGIISSSLGGHGSGACPAMTSPSNVDMAHLLARESEDSEVNDLPTYLNKGFLAWDPDQKRDVNGEPERPDPEDGEADIEGDSPNDLNDTSLVEQL